MCEKVLYVSSIDISLGKGPSVNERTFIKHLSEILGDDAFFVFGKNKYPLEFEISNKFNRMTSPQNNKIIFPFIETYKLIVSIYLIIIKRIKYIFVRVEPFPFAIFILSLLYPGRIYIKTFGGGLMNSLSNKRFWKYLNGLNDFMTKKILQNSKAVDTVSEEFRNAIHANYNISYDKIHLVDNGVDLSVFRKLENDKKKVKEIYGIPLLDYDLVIGYTGNLADVRGGVEVINAVEYLLLSGIYKKKVCGIILGGGSSDKVLKDLALSKGIDDSIYILGNIPYLDVAAISSCLDIGFSILKQENQGASAQKVRQYLASNTYIISTPGQDNFIEELGVGTIIEYGHQDDINKAVLSYAMGQVVPKELDDTILEKFSTFTKAKQRLELIKSTTYEI